MSAVPWAVWLIPEDLSRWTDLVDELARRFGTPSFTPHATLISGAHERVEPVPGEVIANEPLPELIAAAEYIARTLGPVGLSTAGFSWDTEFTTAFYACLAGLEFERAVLLALEVLPDAHPPAMGPHMSLLYAEPEHAPDRARLAEELRPRVPPSVRFDSVQLVLPGPGGWHDVADWRRAAAIALA